MRTETLLVDYLGAEDSEYTKAATQLWLYGAYMRAMKPGCKFDYMIVLSGPQGCGKSMLASKLGGEWYGESLTISDMSSNNKDGLEKIRGRWICEVPELSGMRKSEQEAVKSFITRTNDDYREAYGRHKQMHPRACVLIGTTNEDGYLRDTTGNRRFLPIPVTGQGKLHPWDMTDDDRKQIWAEVKELAELEALSLKLPDELLNDADEARREALETSEDEGLIEEFLNANHSKAWVNLTLDEKAADYRYEAKHKSPEELEPIQETFVLEIWECVMRPRYKRDRTRADSDTITRTLLKLGWKKAGAQRTKCGMQKLFRRG